jgi:hypothetical protein
MCRQNDYPLSIRSDYIFKINYRSQNFILSGTLHYLEEFCHIKSFFKHTKVENWT